MSNDDSLDAFLTADMPAEEKKNNKDTSLEDEFAKLLNDFINQDKPAAKPDNKKTEDSLDSFLESSGSGLDSFLTSPVVPSENTPAAQPQQTSFNAESVENAAQPTEVDNLSGLEVQSVSAAPETAPENIQADDTAANRLKQEEQELARAVANFQDGIVAMADKKNLKVPGTDYKEDMLYPNYKPSIGKKIAQYLLACWDIMNKYDPENMKRLSKDAGDEEYLAFAETLNDTDMQLAIISYVEILINLEICEVSYEQKKEILQKNRIKRELYEEYMELQERKALFIKKLKEKDFRIIEYGATSLSKMSEEFVYTAYENGIPVKTFPVGPSWEHFTPLDSISPLLRMSVMQSEDGAFFYHKGFLPDAMREALIYDLQVERFARGGSTITMQLVKNVFLNRNKNFARKLEEALIVWLIETERLTSKERMYEVYLNIAEWGPLVYGIQEASAYYFGKRPSQLTTEESIFLASIIPKPKHFRSSFAENGRLKENMEGYYKLIAGRLAKKGLISEIEADSIRPDIQVTGDALNSLVGETPESSSPTAEEQ